MRFNLDATAPQLAQAAGAMGIATIDRSAEAAAEEAIGTIYAMIGRMGLPQRLRDVGMRKEDLPGLAQVALQSRAVQSNPKPITSAVQIEEVLRAAW
jgi:alcohol dehydrogenase class IV